MDFLFVLTELFELRVTAEALRASIKEQSHCLIASYCVMCSRILPFLVFYVFQGNEVTPLKCGEIYHMDFVANFMEKMTMKKIANRSTFVRLMNECIVAQFLLRHGV